MQTTPISLLQRLRTSGDRDAWGRFVALYFTQIDAWVKRYGKRWAFQEADVEDARHGILVKLYDCLAKYERQEGHSFRAWLMVVVRNHCHDIHRSKMRSPSRFGDGPPGTEEDRETTDEPDDAEERRQLLGRLLRLVRPDFSERTWSAFTDVHLEGRAVEEVAERLGMTRNAVYLALNRVMTRLRQEKAELLD
jgi:RNA polymerase sigma factor (sigma-70 family)